MRLTWQRKQSVTNASQIYPLQHSLSCVFQEHSERSLIQRALIVRERWEKGSFVSCRVGARLSVLSAVALVESVAWRDRQGLFVALKCAVFF